ncbi:MAG: HAD-IA family hydrolase [Gammaproteobacteria bacterium]|nr:HAD-IA family hydrolase [Gammaproteobacteria bacterium]MDH3848917.1 HAD-IA family hydrolase [Gammaproteobacteria bacterium]MDH3864085.1 HAD-IA family hydrolase [Gammaproteobacteria bacterium]MDH3905679.1 HAD-IA family hydrolase [Gammaproteobacteria bacterium]MDH4006049.1 HAD-IA family hydrolase [Gammaproteobacteria bacterium]
MSPFDTGRCNAVLFDLDGTLVDTAPDMVAVLQDMQRAHELEPVDYDLGRAYVSNGALGLLSLGFPETQHAVGSELHRDYLQRYAHRVCDASTLFPGLERLLEIFDIAGLPWGVVTNKPAHLTDPLLEGLALAARSACTVSGDTLPQRKPDPAPLLHACDIAGLLPQNTVYIGDASRDIQAGQNAGMATIAAAYGYVTPDDDPRRWGADLIASDTAELTQILLKAVNLDA